MVEVALNVASGMKYETVYPQNHNWGHEGMIHGLCRKLNWAFLFFFCLNTK